LWACFGVSKAGEVRKDRVKVKDPLSQGIFVKFGSVMALGNVSAGVAKTLSLRSSALMKQEKLL
jgi:hypothetical protein